jgi:hypothetical protein
VKWKKAKAALAKRSPAVRNKEGSTPRLATSEAKFTEPTATQEILGPGWNRVLRGVRVIKAFQADDIPTT